MKAFALKTRLLFIYKNAQPKRETQQRKRQELKRQITRDIVYKIITKKKKETNKNKVIKIPRRSSFIRSLNMRTFADNGSQCDSETEISCIMNPYFKKHVFLF